MSLILKLFNRSTTIESNNAKNDDKSNTQKNSNPKRFDMNSYKRYSNNYNKLNRENETAVYG